MPVQLIRQYTQLTRTYSVKMEPMENEYIVNIVTREPFQIHNQPISVSVTYEGLEVEDETERELILNEVNQYQMERN
jgi:hypothetical protein